MTVKMACSGVTDVILHWLNKRGRRYRAADLSKVMCSIKGFIKIFICENSSPPRASRCASTADLYGNKITIFLQMNVAIWACLRLVDFASLAMTHVDSLSNRGAETSCILRGPQCRMPHYKNFSFAC